MDDSKVSVKVRELSALFKKARRGDQVSLVALYQKVKFMWHSIPFKDATGAMTIEDWRSEADLHWFKNWSKWDSKKSSFSTYSYTIVMNRLRSINRDMQYQKRIPATALITSIASDALFYSGVYKSDDGLDTKELEQAVACKGDKSTMCQTVFSLLRAKDIVIDGICNMLMVRKYSNLDLAKGLGVSLREIKEKKEQLKLGLVSVGV